jgi:hypothetical protein
VATPKRGEIPDLGRGRQPARGVRVSTVLSAGIIAAVSLVGSALLATWILVRKADLGPQTLRGASMTILVSMVLLSAAGPAVLWMVGFAGRPVALLTVADPIFVLAFWSAGLLIRAFVGGGTGEPRRAYARSRRGKHRR